VPAAIAIPFAAIGAGERVDAGLAADGSGLDVDSAVGPVDAGEASVDEVEALQAANSRQSALATMAR
jgi:hypothetical protein